MSDERDVERVALFLNTRKGDPETLNAAKLSRKQLEGGAS
jgi:hypothetical protein